MQLEHQDSRFEGRAFSLILICDQIVMSSNAGGLFRLADAFGIKELWFIGSNTPMGQKMRKASRNTHKHVSFKVLEDYQPIKELKTLGYKLVALEITQNSEDINRLQLEQNSKVALIIGGEGLGITPELLSHCHKTYHIEMYGSNSSMNVTTATAIGLKYITDQLF